MNYIPKKIIVLENVCDKISKCILSIGNMYEVGGVLLGYRWLHTWFIVDVTIPIDQELKSKTVFLLDGEKETKMIKKIVSMYRIAPEPVGIWHSHVGGIKEFSDQDKESNSTYAQQIGGAISAIAIPSLDKELEELVVYYILPTKEDVLFVANYKGCGKIWKKYIRKSI